MTFTTTLLRNLARAPKLAVTILKYRGKRQVNTRVKGISHIKKLLMACETCLIGVNDKNSEISLYALISNATGLHVQRIQRVK